MGAVEASNIPWGFVRSHCDDLFKCKARSG